MNKRITFVSILNDIDLQKIEHYTKQLQDQLCKVPFGRNIDRREADLLPYHFTFSSWDSFYGKQVINGLSKIGYPKLKICINDIGIINGKENSYVLCFVIRKNEELKLLQSKLSLILPNEQWNCSYFHITIHIDKDYDKINSMKEKLLENFTPFELEVDTFGLYEIYPAKLIEVFHA